MVRAYIKYTNYNNNNDNNIVLFYINGSLIKWIVAVTRGLPKFKPSSRQRLRSLNRYNVYDECLVLYFTPTTESEKNNI